MTSILAKWNWSKESQKAFETMKKLVSREILLYYPNFNKPFVIHIDPIKLQSGAVICQYVKPIVFHRRKLNSA